MNIPSKLNLHICCRFQASDIDDWDDTIIIVAELRADRRKAAFARSVDPLALAAEHTRRRLTLSTLEMLASVAKRDHAVRCEGGDYEKECAALQDVSACEACRHADQRCVGRC
eukprot:4403255-Pleurochrysis_carterae.AAC.1